MPLSLLFQFPTMENLSENSFEQICFLRHWYRYSWVHITAQQLWNCGLLRWLYPAGLIDPLSKCLHAPCVYYTVQIYFTLLVDHRYHRHILAAIAVSSSIIYMLWPSIWQLPPAKDNSITKMDIARWKYQTTRTKLTTLAAMDLQDGEMLVGKILSSLGTFTHEGIYSHSHTIMYAR